MNKYCGKTKKNVHYCVIMSSVLGLQSDPVYRTLRHTLSMVFMKPAYSLYYLAVVLQELQQNNGIKRRTVESS